LNAFLKSKINTLASLLLFRDKDVFYKPYYGSLDFLRMLISNIFSPGRILNRIKYKRFPVSKPKVPVKDNSLVINPSELSFEDLVELTVSTINHHGGAVIDGFFPEEYLDEFRKKHTSFFPSLDNESIDAPEIFEGGKMSLDIQDLWMNDFIVKVIQGYIGRLPYARQYPEICEIRPRRKTTSRDFSLPNCKGNPSLAEEWHVDHSCLIQAAVFFDDVVANGSHMEVISGSHRMVGSRLLSHEYVDKSRWASKVLPCIGKKGSIQFHCGNVYHHLSAVPQHSRCWLKLEFTSGPNILMSPSGIVSLLAGSSNYDDLTPKRKQILSGLLPPLLNKGYQPHNGGLVPTKFKGI
jgi:hypothetical protein